MTYPLFTRDNCYTDYETLLLPDFVLGANMAAYANDQKTFTLRKFSQIRFFNKPLPKSSLKIKKRGKTRAFIEGKNWSTPI